MSNMFCSNRKFIRILWPIHVLDLSARKEILGLCFQLRIV